MKHLKDFKKFEGALIQKSTLDQLKKVKSQMKGVDIDDRVRKDIKEPPKQHHDPLKTIQTYQQYMAEPFKVNQNVKQVKEGLFDMFKKDPHKKYLNTLSEKIGIRYHSRRLTEKGETRVSFGPKNGHEIVATLKEYTTGDSIGDAVGRRYGEDRFMATVRPSYYGTFYEKEQEVNDLEDYLMNFDFDFKPKVTHKFNYMTKESLEDIYTTLSGKYGEACNVQQSNDYVEVHSPMRYILDDLSEQYGGEVEEIDDHYYLKIK
ncbi:MAG: hypothetical protein SLAVMIC_00492 [uncultured marine phage]|uniref:Uncharacterized protein n=1 Tax=uncultured marine phage TaxID=707152 RepID=A0A8D9FQT9_9VIRU|nr:MAG: hypothetical protein SLAVMIC_00492 [uncultured marine phage]